MKFEPILTSILDNDLYKLTMGSVVFHLFPRAQVTYKFHNRGKTPFPEGFSEALHWQIEAMAGMELTYKERCFLLSKVPYLRPTYVEWLEGYQYDPNEVAFVQDGGNLEILIKGPWYRTIFWEVPLMALISELYFKMTGQTIDAGYIERTKAKGEILQETGCHWIDFGTRRRYSYAVQNEVVRTLSYYKGFLGTSNVHFAHLHGVKAHGTYAHEYVMGMQALYGARLANEKATEHWSEHFDGLLGTALTDTFTTKNFRQSFGPYAARLFDGVRHDSENPYLWGDEMLGHYKSLNIDARNKRFVFSDALKITAPHERQHLDGSYNYVALDMHFRRYCQPVGGIGTYLTNDVGVKPLNMVIKLATADFGHGPVDVVKLSDTPGKHTGNPEAIDLVKRELGIS